MFSRFALVFLFALSSGGVAFVRAAPTRYLHVSAYVVSPDGVSSFDVVVPPDGSLNALGHVQVTKIDVVSPDFASYAYGVDGLVARPTPVTEASCVYAGYSPSSIVSLVSCGDRGPTISFTLLDGTTYRARKSDGALGSVEGAYAVEIFAGDERANGTATAFDGAFGTIGHLDAQMPYLDLSSVTLSGVSSESRRRLLQGTTQRVTFDYVFVSDYKRYLNYASDDALVLADTIAEIATANAIYLVGDKFTPQIQFRMKKHIVWTTLPSVMTQTNVESGPYDAASGEPQNPIDISLYLRDFGKYAFHVSEYDLFTKAKVTGEMETVGNEAHGWHLLTGNFGGTYGGQMTVGLANVNSTCQTFHDAYRAGCETLLNTDNSTYEQFYTGIVMASDSSGMCVPNFNYGLTSTLNTPGHYFPGLILAHELGHNLGFSHVYNGGDQGGNVDGCLTSDPHDGTAVMGHDGNGTNVVWSQCSVNKFQSQWASSTDHAGNPVGEGGLYACASSNFDTTKLPAATNPFAAFTAEETLHHIASPPPSASTPPPTTASPPPVPPVPAGHATVSYKLTIDTTMTDHQKTILRQALSQNNDVHSVI